MLMKVITCTVFPSGSESKWPQMKNHSQLGKYQVRRCTGQLVPSDVGQTRHDGSAYQTCTSTVRNEFK